MFLIINAWELSLKALLSRAGQSIFYPKKRSQPYRTLTWQDALNRAVGKRIWPDDLPHRAIEENLDLLNTYRDNVVHFYNAPGFGVIIHGLAQTSILNYRDLLRGAFDQELASEISWQLMPLEIEPPIDPLNFLKGIRPAEANTRAVEQFLTALRNATATLEEEGVDTGRLLTAFDVSLQSVKKVEKADVVIGVDSTSSAEQVLVTRRMDPNITHPYRQTEVLEKLGRGVSSYTFQAVVWRFQLRDKAEMFWQDQRRVLSKWWSPEVVIYVNRLSKAQIEEAVADYREYRRGQLGRKRLS